MLIQYVSMANAAPPPMEVAGYFVNTLVLASELGPESSFAEQVEAARRSVLGALEHRQYPFRRLCVELQPEHDPSRSPRLIRASKRGAF